MGKKAARRAQAAADAATPVPDRHALYAQAVQSPKGDAAYLCRFFAQYASPRVPLHLREDFCGTAALCAAWVASDARRSAVGTDFDAVELSYGAAHVVPPGARVALLHANVLDDPLAAPPLAGHHALAPPAAAADAAEGASTAAVDWRALRALRADVGCAFNCALCFMHSRGDAEAYLRRARAMTASPGIFVLDLQGGHTMEKALTMRTRLASCDYIWEQEGFDPLTRLTRCHIGFRLRGRRGAPPPPTPPALRRAFSYHWRLWTMPEAREMLAQAGFARTHVWMRRMREDGEAPSDGEETAAEGSDSDVRSSSSSDAAASDDGSGSSDDADGDAGARRGGRRGGGWRREGKSRDEYVEVTPATPPAMLHRLARGWQAYIVAVVDKP